MASSKRERELARMRAERQAARRSVAVARRRRQRSVLLSVLAAVAVIAVVAVVVLVTRGSGNKTDKLATSKPSPSASATGAAVATSCHYTPSGAAAKTVKGLPPTVPVAKDQTATLLTNRGTIQLALAGTKAPCTVGSFAFLAAQKYFDKTPCHRLTTAGIYVLQCGDPSGKGSGGPGYAFADEKLTGATYPRGTVAMANSGPGTNGSQFFLVYKDTQLPPSYTPFGTITKGLDLLAKVAAAGTKTGGDGPPKLPVTLEKVTTGAA